MTKAKSELHHVIRSVVMRKPGSCANVTLQLWESLASQLVLIIGEAGFKSLFQRSLHLTGERFSWLMTVAPSSSRDAPFAALVIRLNEQDVEEATEATIALLIVFIDILAMLIGDPLTTSIVRSAWGDDAFDLAVTEFKK
jgi:hypothetical protein